MAELVGPAELSMGFAWGLMPVGHMEAQAISTGRAIVANAMRSVVKDWCAKFA